MIEDDGTAGDFGFTADGKVKKHKNKHADWLIGLFFSDACSGGGWGGEPLDSLRSGGGRKKINIPQGQWSLKNTRTMTCTRALKLKFL